MFGNRTIQIRRNTDGRWIVARDDPKKPFKPGDRITWTLDPKEYPNISAHFQFVDLDLVEDWNKGASPPAITADLTAKIDQGAGSLLLQIRKDVFLPLSKRFYAVWIRDPALPLGGWYAVGETLNPPPELDLGP
ncbi:MAG: hypothetical protein JSW03_00745 [Candidatus Eiseniibacteriota bacterium]|nr:MAG: hypothetical protein JSW03_00745 [Candidatus Eisenbacteria bacterium]